ncbi:hypothetical protein FEM48_Zijuj01G0176600 [Ziziphus jujuba var. spinosa]|uniref:Uncharacterized protein n=1 Tax=Ziziphus jujuba var. spinosa TaxID=714518 RepID=A0A978W2M8_ZIZJJ|nr:hypothetical protein FEM48_Zijuj01G0176600 [Ziziphus jujuba var. spinosa]
MNAINIIFEESNRVDSIDPNIHLCGCVYHCHTHRLPCAHEIVKYKCEGQSIPFSCVDFHWKKLDLMVPPEDMTSILFMISGCPMPPVVDKWFKHRLICTQGWKTPYALQIKAFKDLISNDMATQETIDLDNL